LENGKQNLGLVNSVQESRKKKHKKGKNFEKLFLTFGCQIFSAKIAMFQLAGKFSPGFSYKWKPY